MTNIVHNESMADASITQLANYTTPASSDVLPIVDITNSATKKIAVSVLDTRYVKKAGDTMVGALGFNFSGMTYQLTSDRFGGNYLNIVNTVGIADIVVLDSTTNGDTTDSESTITLRVNVGTGGGTGSEFIDRFVDHYTSNGDVIHGTLIQHTGTGVYRDYLFGFYDAADTDPSNQIKKAERFYRIASQIPTGTTTTRVRGQIKFRPTSGTDKPTAHLHIGAGVGGSTTGSAPLKIDSGTNLTTPEGGTFEYDGTHLYFTTGDNVRHTLI